MQTAIALAALVVAGLSLWYAHYANDKADTANRIAGEANDIAGRALAREEQRDRAAARPELHVKLGAGHKPRGTFDVAVSHDGAEQLDEVRLEVTNPAVMTFFPGMREFYDQGGEPLPQDDARFIGTLSVGETRLLQTLWRDFDQKTTTVVSTIRIGDDTWKRAHVLDIEDDSRFDGASA